jgi:hypothetical protein
MFCLVLKTHAAKGELQIIQVRKTCSFGKKTPLGNELRHGRFLALQKRNSIVDGMDVLLAQRKNASAVVGKTFLFARRHVEDSGNALFAKKRQRYFNAEIGLPAADASGIKKTFEIGSSRVGGV